MHWAQRLKIIICCLPSLTDLLLDTQHPQLWLPRCGKLNHKVQGEVQDPASSMRSPPFLFLLLYKHSRSGSRLWWCHSESLLQDGGALLVRPQPRRTIQVSVRPLTPAGEAPALGLKVLLLAAVVLSRSLWRLINDVIQTRQIRALRRKIVKSPPPSSMRSRQSREPIPSPWFPLPHLAG